MSYERTELTNRTKGNFLLRKFRDSCNVRSVSQNFRRRFFASLGGTQPNPRWSRQVQTNITNNNSSLNSTTTQESAAVAEAPPLIKPWIK